MVFVGMHPVFTQVPPKRPRSMIATFMPAAVSRPARGGPACPVPMMIASYDWFMVGRFIANRIATAPLFPAAG
jgi:hypothetical protein